mgnify:FL=1
MIKKYDYAKIVLLICLTLVIIFSLLSKPVMANDKTTYKDEISDLMKDEDNYGDEEYYHVKFNKNTSNLSINIKLPDRKDIYYGEEYRYDAIKAVKMAKLRHTKTVTIKDSSDKYTFNLADIKSLNLKDSFIKQWGQQNDPSDYSDAKDQHDYDILRRDYVNSVLLPKAINHVNYDKDLDDD